MICPPCAAAADESARALAEDGRLTFATHSATTCRDATAEIQGCTCQHGPQLSTAAQKGFS